MRIASNRISDIIQYFRKELEGIYPPGEIGVMIAWCFEDFCNISGNALRGKLNDTVNESDLLRFSFAVKDLKAHKPLQYVLGAADFYGLKFFVNENVLIPRPETEELVDLIIRENPDADSILDIGTGSGCIAVTLKKKLPASEVSAMDISEKALDVARENALRNQVSVNFINADILSGDLPARAFNVIVSNPPYIAEDEKSLMEKNVLDHEPHLALFVRGNDPALFFRRIISLSKKALAINGRLYFEINPHFAEDLKSLMMAEGFRGVVLYKDINNKNRILRGTK